MISPLLAALSLQLLTSNVVFYGGDSDLSGGWVSARNMAVSDARVYDNFDLGEPTVVEGLWGNFLFAGDTIPREAYYEIRQKVSEGNSGTLIASGTMRVVVMRTGRVASDFDELHVRGRLSTPISLPAGRYWLAIAPIGFGTGMAYASEVSGTDEGPPGDPNPPVTGSPIRDLKSFLDCPELNENYTPLFDDFSYGVGVLTTYARTRSLADSFTITRGVAASGGLYELWGLDDERLVVQQRYPFNASSPNVQVVAETSTPVPANPNGNRLTLTVESRCTGAPSNNVIERIEVFDFSQNQWVVVSERAPSSADRRTAITRTGRYVEPGTNKLMARVSWFDRGAVNLNWTGEIDWILWDISP